MRCRGLLFTLAAAAMAATPVHAQQSWEGASSLHHALARAIETALPAENDDQGLSWSGFGLRGARDVFWPLVTPQQAVAMAADARQSRQGWIAVNLAHGELRLCGDREQVEQMDVLIHDGSDGGHDLIALLRDRGVGADLVETGPHRPLNARPAEGDDPGGSLDDQPDLRRWRLHAPQRQPATLTAIHGCTRPGTRSRTQCATLWSLRFHLSEEAEEPISCLGLGRYAYSPSTARSWRW